MADLEELPDVGDVGVRHRVVRAVPIHPLSEPLRLTCLDRGVLGNAVAAGASEPVETVLLDLLLRVETKRLLDLDLDPQPLTVEPILVAQLVASHRAMALHQIFERTSPRVMHAHRIVRGDRTVDERIGRAASILGSQLLERRLGLPQREHAVL